MSDNDPSSPAASTAGAGGIVQFADPRFGEVQLGEAQFGEAQFGEVWARRGSVDHVVTLSWSATPGVDATSDVHHAIRWAFERGFTRVEALLDPADALALSVARTAGLRWEGIARGAGQSGGGSDAAATDRVLVARLLDDVDPAVDPLPTIAAGFPRITAAAGVVVRDPQGRVLMLQTSYKVPWEIPGGLMEVDEGPQQTVRREVWEELGVDLPVGDVLAIHFVPQDAPRPAQLAMILDGGRLATDAIETLTFPDGEIVAAHWCGRQDIASHASAALALRLTAILDAFDDGRLPGPSLVL